MEPDFVDPFYHPDLSEQNKKHVYIPWYKPCTQPHTVLHTQYHALAIYRLTLRLKEHGPNDQHQKHQSFSSHLNQFSDWYSL